jgi:hypothetical protein
MGVPEFTNTLISVSQLATDYHSISIFNETGMMNILKCSEIDNKINQIKEIDVLSLRISPRPLNINFNDFPNIINRRQYSTVLQELENETQQIAVGIE